MASPTAKAALFDAFASAAQALGSGRRAEIVDLLAQGERPVEEIANEISQSVANTSQHLHVLARAGLVRSRREPRSKRREVVAYCRGPYCVYADEAVRLLRERGLRACRLDVGFPEWRRAGLPVELAN